jgi:hypothetical protein
MTTTERAEGDRGQGPRGWTIGEPTVARGQNCGKSAPRLHHSSPVPQGCNIDPVYRFCIFKCWSYYTSKLAPFESA